MSSYKPKVNYSEHYEITLVTTNWKKIRYANLEQETNVRNKVNSGIVQRYVEVALRIGVVA